MNKVIATLVAAVVMTAGLVLVSSAPAAAGCSPSQYSGCFRTTTSVMTAKRIPRRTRATICVTVTVQGSNARPFGTVVVRLQKRRSTKVATRELDYIGGKVCIVTRKLKKRGRYAVTATYRSPSNSVYDDSTGTARFKVRGR